LALATAGTYLRRSTFSFERYLQEYEHSWNFDRRWPARLPEYEPTLYTTWKVSYDRLKSEDDKAAQLLGLLAYFSSRRLWYKLFQAGLSDDLPRWLYEIVSDDVVFESAMGTLTDYCFLEVQASTESWSMHTCVHDWTLTTLNQETDKTQYDYAFDCVGILAEREGWDSLANVSLSDLAAHAVRLERICQYHSEVIDNITLSRVDRMVYIAELLRQQVHLPAAEKMYLQLLKAKEELLGPKDPLTLDTVHNIGLLYANQGKMEEAGEMYLRALKGKEEKLGLKHASTLDTVNNLAALYADQEKIEEAEEMYLRALKGKEEK
jgi:tetratricopeptide (TPR) repeat protein